MAELLPLIISKIFNFFFFGTKVHMFSTNFILPSPTCFFLSRWTMKPSKGESTLYGKRFQSSNLFFSKTVGQFGTKVHMKAWKRIGMKINTNELGHMTKMAAMPIYGKNLKKSSSPEPTDQWPWNLVCSIVYVNTTKIVQIISLGWPWPILRQGQIWSHRLLYGKKWSEKNWKWQSLSLKVLLTTFSLQSKNLG